MDAHRRQQKKVNGKTIDPDGTFKDQMHLARGYWEAKDTSDKLDVEMERNRDAGRQYIVCLVGQVARVSVETVKIVKCLPSALSEADGAVSAGSTTGN